MTEADLTRLVQRVIQEQVKDKQIQSVPSKQSDGKLISTISKTDSESWFDSFPCLNDVSKSERPMVDGKIILKSYARPFTLLPQSGRDDPQYKRAQQYKPVNNYIGQIQGGGVYYCSSEAYAKGFGPQILSLQ